MSTIKVNNVIPHTGDTVNINGVTIIDGVLSASTYENLPIIEFTGGTVEGDTSFANGLTATTISATTYENLPNFEFTGGTIDGLTANTISATTIFGDGSNLTGISGAEVITVTKNELDTLIGDSLLIAGSTYKIIGVDSELYGGSTIFLQALTTNKLSINGSGIFYNPKYNETEIYRRNISYNVGNLSGKFSYDENVITDTGALGRVKTYGMVEYLSGDWTSATTISGLSSLATASIDDVIYDNYEIGSEVIWGGKKWVKVSGVTITVSDELMGVGNDNNAYFDLTFKNYPLDINTLVITDGVEEFTGDEQGNLIGNLGGTGSIDYLFGQGYVNFTTPVVSGVNITASYVSTGIGHSLDKYTLNNVWSVVPFNDTDYNVVLDEIEYDVKHDMIIKRKDKFNNEVVGNYQVFSEFMNNSEDYGNPIKDFQWGSGNDNWVYDGSIFYFSDSLDDNNGIDDGGDDMYDGGNEIYTNFGNVTYTHTRLTIDPDNGVPANLFPKNGQVVGGEGSYFGINSGGESQYFTNLYPGLFVLNAQNVNITEFMIDGNLGADGDGELEVDRYILTGFSTNYQVFVKKVYGAGDPSVNHIIIVDSDSEDILHIYDDETEDDLHRIENLSGVTKVYYLLTSLKDIGEGDGYISKIKIDEIVNTFVGLVDGKDIDEVLISLNENYNTITDILPPPNSLIRRGAMRNYVKDSYFDCLNFNGGFIWNNVLEQHSRISGNVFSFDILGQSRISENKLIDYSRIERNYSSNSCNITANVLINNSEISNNKIDGDSDIADNIITLFSEISNNNLYDSSDIRRNKLNDSSYISSNNFISSYGILSNILSNNISIQNNTGTNGRIEYNNLSFNGGVSNNNLINSEINNNKLSISCGIDSNSLTGGTISLMDMFSNSNVSNNVLISENFNGSIIGESKLFSSNISNNELSTGTITKNELFSSGVNNNKVGSGGSIHKNKLSIDSFINDNDLSLQAYIRYNNINNSSVITLVNFETNVRLENCNLENESTINLSNTPTLAFDIKYVNSNNGQIFEDLTSATNIFSNGSKNLMRKNDFSSVLIFIDGNNTQQIVAVNS